MMDSLRAAANHTVLKIILALVVIAFTLSGVGGYLISGHSDYVAKVNGEEISRARYENAVAGQRQQLQQQLGDRYSQLAANDDYMKVMRQQILQQLIDQTLLEQYAKTLKLGISDEQVKRAIFQEPAFQRDNKFDNALYNQLIRNMGMTPDQYAEALREQLTNQQLISALTDTDFMLSGETDNLSALLDQQRVVREATIEVSNLESKQQVSDAETQGYYQQHQSLFTVPEQFRVDYIELDATDISVSVSEQQAQDYYQQHKDEFTAPRQVRYSVIQTKTEAQAQEVLDELKKGADFASLAKEKSTDIISARKGGDLGWMTDNTTPDELKNAALTEKGQLSGVIKSSVGYLVARLDDSKPAQPETFDQVKNSIMDKLKQEQEQKQWYALQQKVSDAASNDNDSLNQAAQVAGVKIQHTDWFNRDDIPKALDYQPLKDVIFNDSLLDGNGHPAGNSDVITTEGDRAFVVRIVDHKAKSVQPLKEVRQQVVDAVKQQKARNEAQQQADKLLAQLKTGKGDAALGAAGLSFGAAQTVSRDDHDPLTQAIFRLSPPASGKVSYGTGLDSDGNVVLLALDAIQPGNMTDQQKQALSQALLQNNTQLALESLISNLRSTATIKINQAAEQ